MDRHSRLVAFLKVVLPLAALGILSTLFLLSRSVDPTTTLPFGEAEISERLRDEVVSAPYFSGVTRQGDQIVLTATSARPEAGGRMARAEDLSARISLSSGGSVSLNALSGSFDPDGDLARFTGDVRIETSTGYRLTTEALETGIKELGARSDGEVQGSGPFGTLHAGQMELTSDSETKAVHLVFKRGVKLVYEPSKRER